MATRPKMRPRSSIDRLPAAVRRKLDAWLDTPGMTQKKATELTNAELERMGLAQRVTRQAVNRHDLRMRADASQRFRPWPALEEWIRTGNAGLAGLSVPQFVDLLRKIAADLNAVADLAESMAEGNEGGERGG